MRKPCASSNPPSAVPSANARIYLSIGHQLDMALRSKIPADGLRGEDLLDHFARIARERGDFDWHLARHPYGENFKDPQF